jgi:orotate phosphoribosyltransferase
LTSPDPEGFLQILRHRKGHFAYESGHHGELWLDLDDLFRRPGRLGRHVADLAGMLGTIPDLDAVCGPLLGGGLLAHAVATQLDCELFIAERVGFTGHPDELFRAEYRVPDSMRELLGRKRVAVIDDVVNAGSAIRATMVDLRLAGATVVGIGALLLLGDRAATYANAQGLPLVHIAELPSRIWAPADCPLCAAAQPLESPSELAH